TLLKFLYSSTCFFDNAREFVTHHGTVINTGFPFVINMKIRATDPSQGYFHNCIGRFEQLGFGDGAVFNDFFAGKGEGMHDVKLRKDPAMALRRKGSGFVCSLVVSLLHCARPLVREDMWRR